MVHPDQKPSRQFKSFRSHKNSNDVQAQSIALPFKNGKSIKVAPRTKKLSAVSNQQEYHSNNLMDETQQSNIGFDSQLGYQMSVHNTQHA